MLTHRASRVIFFVVVVSHILRVGCQPEEATVLYTVPNSGPGLLNREKRTKIESLASALPLAARAEELLVKQRQKSIK